MARDLLAEEWRLVVGFPGYEVSSLGRVRSLISGRTLRPGRRGRYLGFSLRRDGQTHSVYLHHLVASAFLGSRPEGTETCHRDGDRRNNRADNLRYDTHHANMRDTLMHGTHRSLEVTLCARGHELTEENVRVERRRSSDGGIKVRRRCRTCLKVKNRHDYERWKTRIGKAVA